MISVAYASSRLVAIAFPDISFLFPSQACQAANYYIYYDYDKSLMMFLSIYDDYDWSKMFSFVFKCFYQGHYSFVIKFLWSYKKQK